VFDALCYLLLSSSQVFRSLTTPIDLLRASVSGNRRSVPWQQQPLATGSTKKYPAMTTRCYSPGQKYFDTVSAQLHVAEQLCQNVRLPFFPRTEIHWRRFCLAYLV